MTKDMKIFLKWLALFFGTIFWLPISYKLYKSFDLSLLESKYCEMILGWFWLYLFVTILFLTLLIIILQCSFVLRWLTLPILISGYGWMLLGLVYTNLFCQSPVTSISVALKNYQSNPETNSLYIANSGWTCLIISYKSAFAILGIAFGIIIVAFIFSIIGISKKKKK